PYHTIIPAMVTCVDDGRRTIDNIVPVGYGPQSIVRRQSGEEFFAAFGVMGGFMQPQGHVQVFLGLMDELDPQSALDLPRFCLEDGNPSDAVALEEGIPLKVMAKLAEM